LQGIDYIIEECPMVEGNTQHRYKEAITLIEEASPGTKSQMYFGFLKKAASRFKEEEDNVELVACVGCGSPTVAYDRAEPICSFCKTKALATKRREEGFVPRPKRVKRR
jgi:hypothetical protein